LAGNANDVGEEREEREDGGNIMTE